MDFQVAANLNILELCNSLRFSVEMAEQSLTFLITNHQNKRCLDDIAVKFRQKIAEQIVAKIAKQAYVMVHIVSQLFCILYMLQLLVLCKYRE